MRLRLGKVAADLRIGGLVEIPIPMADGREQPRGARADNLVHLGLELLERLGSRYRNSDDEPGGDDFVAFRPPPAWSLRWPARRPPV